MRLMASRQYSPLLAVVAGLMMAWSNSLCGCAMLRSSSGVPQEKVTQTTASEDSSVTRSTSNLESEEKTTKSTSFSSSKRVALTYVAHMPEGESLSVILPFSRPVATTKPLQISSGSSGPWLNCGLTCHIRMDARMLAGRLLSSSLFRAENAAIRNRFRRFEAIGKVSGNPDTRCG